MASSITPASAEVAFAGWTRSVAHRILAGAGSASMLAYRTDPLIGFDYLAHGLTSNGELAVVCFPETSELLDLDREADLEVRLDVVKEAVDAEVSIVSATLHLLGKLRWLSESEASNWALSGVLPPRLAALALAGNALAGVISTERVLLHDATGVTPMPFAEVIAWDEDSECPIFPAHDEEFDAYHLVADRSQDELHAIADALVGAILPGWVVNRPGNACPHTWGKIFCVDVDRHGVLLMRVHEQSNDTCFLAFSDEVTSFSELMQCLGEAAESSAPMRNPRI